MLVLSFLIAGCGKLYSVPSWYFGGVKMAEVLNAAAQGTGGISHRPTADREVGRIGGR